MSSYQEVTDKICKYCHEQKGEMVKPCKCNDYVHITCLDKWNENRKDNENVCEICKAEYYKETTFNGKKCISDIFIYGSLILINLFVIIGFAGYDDIAKIDSPFYNYCGTMVILGSLLVFFTYFFIMVWNLKQFIENPQIPKKYILYHLIFSILAQGIVVTISSSIIGKLFWNLATFITGALFIIIVGILGFLLKLLVQCITFSVRAQYTETNYANHPEQDV